MGTAKKGDKMGNVTRVTDAERHEITEALGAGDAEWAFRNLATYLERNKLTLSDDVLRLYVEKELFACFAGRGGTFMTLMEK